MKLKAFVFFIVTCCFCLGSYAQTQNSITLNVSDFPYVKPYLVNGEKGLLFERNNFEPLKSGSSTIPGRILVQVEYLDQSSENLDEDLKQLVRQIQTPPLNEEGKPLKNFFIQYDFVNTEIPGMGKEGLFGNGRLLISLLNPNMYSQGDSHVLITYSNENLSTPSAQEPKAPQVVIQEKVEVPSDLSKSEPSRKETYPKEETAKVVPASHETYLDNLEELVDTEISIRETLDQVRGLVKNEKHRDKAQKKFSEFRQGLAKHAKQLENLSLEEKNLKSANRWNDQSFQNEVKSISVGKEIFFRQMCLHYFDYGVLFLQTNYFLKQGKEKQEKAFVETFSREVLGDLTLSTLIYNLIRYTSFDCEKWISSPGRTVTRSQKKKMQSFIKAWMMEDFPLSSKYENRLKYYQGCLQGTGTKK